MQKTIYELYIVIQVFAFNLPDWSLVKSHTNLDGQNKSDFKRNIIKRAYRQEQVRIYPVGEGSNCFNWLFSDKC